MRTCNDCGAAIGDTARFCGDCGAPQSAQGSSAAPATPPGWAGAAGDQATGHEAQPWGVPPGSAGQEAGPSKRSKASLVAGAVAAVILLAAGITFAGTWLLGGDDSNSSSEVTGTDGTSDGDPAADASTDLTVDTDFEDPGPTATLGEPD